MPTGATLPKALGFYHDDLLFEVDGTPTAVRTMRLGRGAILKLYRGDEALLAATWPRRSGRGWSHHAAQEAIIAACAHAGPRDPERLGFRLYFPWRDRRGRYRLLNHEEWQRCVEAGRSRRAARS